VNSEWAALREGGKVDDRLHSIGCSQEQPHNIERDKIFDAAFHSDDAAFNLHKNIYCIAEIVVLPTPCRSYGKIRHRWQNVPAKSDNWHA